MINIPQAPGVIVGQGRAGLFIVNCVPCIFITLHGFSFFSVTICRASFVQWAVNSCPSETVHMLH